MTCTQSSCKCDRSYFYLLVFEHNDCLPAGNELAGLQLPCLDELEERLQRLHRLVAPVELAKEGRSADGTRECPLHLLRQHFHEAMELAPIPPRIGSLNDPDIVWLPPRISLGPGFACCPTDHGLTDSREIARRRRWNAAAAAP